MKIEVLYWKFVKYEHGPKMLLLFYRPDLIQYDKLSKSNAMHNLNNAFTTAEQQLGLTRLLDAEGNLIFVYNYLLIFIIIVHTK